MSTPQIAVVIVTYNGAKWVNKCFSSLRQSTVPLKTIVVDNGSSDNTQKEITSNFPEVSFYPSEKNKGFGSANNIGIKMAYDAGAAYVFLLNQDAWIEPDTIAQLIEQHKKSPEFGIISPMHLNGDGSALDPYFSNYIIPSRCPGLYSDVYLAKQENKTYPVESINAAAWLMSRECIEKVGGFSPTFFHYGEDDNYIHRLHYYNLKAGVHPSVVIYHDRELRTNNNFFADQQAVLNRLLVVEFSNPITNKNIFRSKLSFLKKAVFSLIKGQISESKKMWGYFKTLSAQGEEIQKNRNESMAGKKACFLNGISK